MAHYCEHMIMKVTYVPMNLISEDNATHILF